MAGTLITQNIQGPSTGANANKILIPSGQTLAAPGHVVQVVSSNLATRTGFTTSTPFSALSKTITPTSTSSKILVSFNGTFYKANTDTGSAGAARWSVYRDGSPLPDVNWAQNSGTAQYATFTGSNANEHIQPLVGMFMDSPATTSATTYALYLFNSNNTSQFYIYEGAEIILQEIAQ